MTPPVEARTVEMVANPVRIQLSRRKGFRLQEASRAVNGLDAVKVDRTTKYGNPFIVGEDGRRDDCVRYFTFMLGGYFCLTAKPSVAEQRAYRERVVRNLAKLRGKNLACWCRGTPCHADVLLEVANAPPPQDGG